MNIRMASKEEKHKNLMNVVYIIRSKKESHYHDNENPKKNLLCINSS